MDIECAYRKLVKNQFTPVKNELNDKIDKFFDTYSEYDIRYCTFTFKGLSRKAYRNLYRHFRIEWSRYTHLTKEKHNILFQISLEDFSNITDMDTLKNTLLDEMMRFSDNSQLLKEFILYTYIRFFTKYDIY